jgi:hypothetical protein
MISAARDTLGADAGANLRELLERMSPSTARAALIYLHGDDQRNRASAETVSELALQRFAIRLNRDASPPDVAGKWHAGTP